MKFDTIGIISYNIPMTNDIADNPQEAVPVPAAPDGLKNLTLLQTNNSIQKCFAHMEATAAFDDITQELSKTLSMDHNGDNDLEALLAAQSRVLNSAFHRSIDAALPRKNAYDENCMLLALTAQRQCRSTIQTLRALQMAFMREKTKSLKSLTNELLDSEK